MESIGVSHEEDCCEPGCQEQHAFHYVRVRANEHAACRQKGAVDLKLDLHPRLRSASPQALLRMLPSQLEVCATPLASPTVCTVSLDLCSKCLVSPVVYSCGAWSKFTDL